MISPEPRRPFHDVPPSPFERRMSEEMRITQLKKRPFHRRFINSYRSWRKYLGVWASLRAAWMVAR